ncbi:hypothetical protein OW990_21210 [Klebsiella pneumoniae]
MIKREIIEAALVDMAHMQGHALNGQDLLQLRTRIATALAAKERHRQRMNSPAFEWKKPQKPR